MADIKDFTDLLAWQEARKLASAIYKASKEFPKDELFALTSQIRRAVVSVGSNISEGFGRRSQLDKIHFYNMAQTSIDEVRSQLYVAIDLSYIDTVLFESIVTQAITTRKLVSGLIRSIEGTKPALSLPATRYPLLTNSKGGTQ